jgi:alkylated DNA nucleotide flippase Atl1
MRTVIALGLVAALAAVPTSLQGWGMDVHRLLTRRALDELPGELKPFYAERRDFISEHAVDPDLWRVVDLSGPLGNEDPNHFMDLEDLDAPPFRSIPHDWNAYVQKYGLDKANRSGRLPWRTEEIYNRLVTTFQDIAKGTGPSYVGDNARYLSAVLAHYVEDAHVPFHGTNNHDGQLTNQRGIHARFETDLVLRNMPALKFTPVRPRPIANVRDFIFDTLIESQSLVASALQADRKAVEGREFYDDAYFAAFFAGARPVLEKRLNDSVAGVVSVIVSAWEKAGKPTLPLDAPKPPARIRR